MFWLRRKKQTENTEVIQPPPLCRDCRHMLLCNSSVFSIEDKIKHAKCGHPNASSANSDSLRYDLVVGPAILFEQNHCSVERGYSRSRSRSGCGVEGRNFEPIFLDLQPESSESHPIPLMVETNKKELDIAELPHYSRVHRIQH